jgi:hypothetical protein
MQLFDREVLLARGMKRAQRGFGRFIASVTVLSAATASTMVSAATITVNPGQSIATGISSAAAGDTVVVNAGTYTGGIVINKSIAVQANGAVTLQPSSVGTGQAISVRCNSCAVIGFVFQDFGGGVSPDTQTHSSVTIKGNIFRRGASGIWIAGSAWLVEGNEIDGLPLSPGAEDYANVFGSMHVIRHNYFHGLRIPQDLGAGPDYKHNDSLQFWNNNGEVLHDILIEENIFTDFVQGIFLANETGVLSSMSNITISNNVFWGTNFITSGNLMGKPSHGVFVGKAAIPGVAITNNLFHNCMNSVSLYNMPSTTVVQGNIIEQYNTAYALSESAQPNRGTGNALWSTVQGAWDGAISSLAPDKRLDPQLGTTVVGPDGLPWTADDGWRPRNSAAAAYGPQVTVGGGDTPTTTVTAVNDAFSGINEDSAAVLLSVLSNDTVSPAGTLSISSVGPASKGGTVSVSGSSVSYRPAANAFGTETFSYTAREAGGATATATATVTVTAVNDPPAAGANSYTVEANTTAATFTVLANDTDIDGDTLTITDLSATDNGGTVSVSDSALSYSPALNFFGTESFSYTISDGNGATATASVTVTVVDNNTAPIATADAVTVPMNDTGNIISVCANDSDPDAGDTVTVAGLGIPDRGGSVSLATSQTVNYSPAANYTGTETFTYTIKDRSGATASARVTVTVKNTSPTANRDRFKVRKRNTTLRTADEKYRLPVLRNDVSNSGTPLTLAGAVQDARAIHGLVEIDGNDLLYTPPADFTGSEVFLYTVRDANNQSATGEVTVEITDQIGLNLCDDYAAILVEMAELYYDFGLTGADFDSDGIPDDFMLEAMQIVACFDNKSSLGIAVQTAYAINLLSLDGETNAAALSGYREAIAAMMSMNTQMQGALNQTLDVAGLTLSQTYQAVSCDDTGVCMPQPVAGQSLSEAFQVFDPSRAPIEQPFSGAADLDQDGLTNAEEYANVISVGGSSTEYAIAVTDPNLDGSTAALPDNSGTGAGGGGCFIATAAYGTPLASQIDVLRAIRDRDLLVNSLGAAFVDSYYRLSPPVARLVADHPAFAMLVRVTLWPVIIAGKALLAAPMLALIAMLAMMTAAAFRVHRRRQNA